MFMDKSTKDQVFNLLTTNESLTLPNMRYLTAIDNKQSSLYHRCANINYPFTHLSSFFDSMDFIELEEIFMSLKIKLYTCI